MGRRDITLTQRRHNMGKKKRRKMRCRTKPQQRREHEHMRWK